MTKTHYTIPECATYLGLPDDKAVKELIKDNRLHSVTVAGETLVTMESAEALGHSWQVETDTKLAARLKGT